MGMHTMYFINVMVALAPVFARELPANGTGNTRSNLLHKLVGKLVERTVEQSAPSDSLSMTLGIPARRAISYRIQPKHHIPFRSLPRSWMDKLPSRRHIQATAPMASELQKLAQEGDTCSVAEQPDGTLRINAAKEFRRDETVLSVAVSEWVTVETVAQSAIGPFVRSLEPWLQLALFLMSERAAPSTPYLASLATSTSNSPLFWSDTELAMLQGSQLLTNALGYRRFVTAKFAQLDNGLFTKNRAVFPENLFTEEAFAWAFGCVRARVHAPLVGADTALVPLVDFVMHDGSSSQSLVVDEGGLFSGRVAKVKADRKYRPGDPLRMNYGGTDGGLGNKLALDYGVADEATAGYLLRIGIPDDDEFIDDKLDIAETAGLGKNWAFTLRPAEPAPVELLAFLRLINCKEKDSFHLEGLFRGEAWYHFLDPISKENEAEICQGMIAFANQTLNAYPSTIDKDVPVLNKLMKDPNAGARERLALQVRLGEMQTLDNVLVFFQDRLLNLKTLEYYAELRLKSLKLLDEDGEFPEMDEGL